MDVSGSRLEQTSRLIGEIYEASLDDSRWERVMEAVATSFDCVSALIRILDPDHSKVDIAFTYGFTEAARRDYADHFVHIDPFVSALNARPVGYLGISQEILSDRELIRTEYYNDYMRPHARFHLAGGFIVREQGRVVQLALQRERQTGLFDSSELQTLGMLAGHIKRSFHFSRLIRQSRLLETSLSQSLERISIPVILLSQGLTVTYMNPAAEILIDESKDVFIANNRVIFSDSGFASRLKRQIADNRHASDSSSAPGNSAVHAAVTGELKVVTAPLPAADALEITATTGIQADTLLFLSRSGDGKTLDPAILRSLYGLTVAEARLVGQLAGGMLPDAIRERFQLSRNTLKTQLRSIFRKTGVHNQADLQRLVLSGPEAALHHHTGSTEKH